MPYPSESETDTTEESFTGSESDSDHEDSRITRENDPRYALLRKPDASQQIRDNHNAPGSPWDASTNITSLKNHAYITPPKTTKTSLFSMKSINRDKNVFPTPYNFQIKMPRVYKNITKFQLVQMSFPNSSGNVTGYPLFLSTLVLNMINNGIPSSCISSCIAITNCSAASNTVAMMEMSRTNVAGDPLLTTVAVPDGSYTNLQLADELTFQANSTPPLNTISYSAFADAFMNTRDASILFNEPGDTFYSKTGTRLSRPTKDAIMTTYYSQQHIDSLPVITEKIAFTAYYFPIMKELVATGVANPFIEGYDELAPRVSGLFEGLDSEYYYSILSANQSALDGFRQQLTFETRNVNSYSWKFNDKENRFVTIHNQLHSSIQRDIAKSYQTVLNRELALASLNPSSFATIKTNTIGYAAIYKHLETNLSSVLGLYTLGTAYRYHGGENHYIQESTFTATGLSEDESFNGMFQYRSSIGGIYGNYTGVIMDFRNFMDYHSTLSTYYTIVQSTNAAVTRIQQSITMNHHMYVSTKYTGILPPDMIDKKAYQNSTGIPVSFVTGQGAYVPGIPPIAWNTRVNASPTVIPNVVPVDSTSLQNTIIMPDTDTAPLDVETLGMRIISTTPYNPTVPLGPDPCMSTCCTYINRLLTKWYAGIPVNSVIGTMDYRLGLLNVLPNQYNIISTILNFTSSGNLNMLMQINDEQGFNNMDIAMQENYAVGNDTTGQLKYIAAKILMGNVGDYGISQTLIQNPSIFENTLGKLDRLSFKIYYDDQNLTPAWQYLPFQYDVNEWNATFQIDEEVGFINQDDMWNNDPSLPVPENPNDTPYIYFAKKPDEK